MGFFAALVYIEKVSERLIHRLDTLLQARFNKEIKVAVEDALRVTAFNVRA